jgi:hypothetical protein
MARTPGNFNFPLNFEGLLKAPIDAKQLVGTHADLILPATWCASGAVWLYDGAIVVVSSDPTPANNGIYWLCDAVNYTCTCSWIKAGSGTGAGTLTGATNGLSLFGISRTSVGLGGTITGATTITIGSGGTFVISDSRTTPVGIVYATDYSGTYTPRSLVDKQYVDNIASGLLPKEAVIAATTGNTLIYPFSGLSIVDGIQTTEGMRILIKDPANSITNGIWLASASGWTRAGDFDGTPTGETVSGSYMWVLSGDTNKDTSWVLNTPDPIIVHDPPQSGDTKLNFVLYNHVKDVQSGNAGIVVSAVTGIHYICLDTVAMAVRSNALTGATNGLSYSNRCICLGGSLNNETTIDGAYNFNIDTNKVNLTGSTGFRLCAGVGQVLIDGCTTAAGMLRMCAGGGCVCLGTYGLYYDADYASGNTSNPRWLPDKEYVNLAISAATSGITGTITGATNGLHVSGKDIALGGTLTGSTIISGTTNLGINVINLNLTGSTSLNLGGTVTLQSIPASGTTTDATLVWNSSDKQIKQIPLNIVNVCNVIAQYTATTNNSFIGVSGTSCICLMNSPSIGQKISVADICGCALVNNIIIDAGTGKKINDSQCSTINTNYGSVTFIYNGYFWSAVAFTN